MSDPLVRNERTKLLANALNTACTLCFTVGVATPVAGYVYNVSGFRSAVDFGTVGVGALGWLAAAAGLHMAARAVLGGLKP